MHDVPFFLYICIVFLRIHIIGTVKSLGGTATFGINKVDKVVVVKIGNDSIKVQL